ncbi:MAG: class I SAM-dependent methyltransferase [Planctomycetaceae bacterium]
MGDAGAKDATRALFDLVAPDYERTGVAFFEPIGRRLVELAGPRPGERVLDVGCGRGAVLFPAAAAVGPTGHVTGFDLAPAMVALVAQEVAERGLTNVDVRVGDAEDPPVPASSFDHVLASLVLPFVPDVPRAITAVLEVLVPGGRFGFTTFGDGDARWEPLEALLVGAAGDADDPDERGSEEEEGPLASIYAIREILAAAGCVDLQIRDEPFRVVFETPERWLAWFRSTSGTALLEAIPPERRHDVVARALALVDTLRGDDGSIGMGVAIRYTSARRP